MRVARPEPCTRHPESEDRDLAAYSSYQSGREVARLSRRAYQSGREVARLSRRAPHVRAQPSGKIRGALLTVSSVS